MNAKSVYHAMQLPEDPVLVRWGCDLPTKHELDGQPGVYGWYSPIDNKVYVGSGIDVVDRGLDHAEPAGSSNAGLKAAMTEYGLHSFVFIVFCLGEPDNYLRYEQIYLDHFHEDCKYNIFKYAGSPRGYKHTDATKQLLSELKSGSNNPMYGKHHTAQSKALIRAAKLGLKSPNSKEVTLVYADTYEFYGTYPTLKEAGDSVLVDRSTVGKAIAETRPFTAKTKPALKLRAYFGPYVEPQRKS